MCLIWLGIPPCGRAYFLLLRQKKVAKEKATPRSAVAPRLPCATRCAGRFARTRLRLRHGKPKSPGPPALLSAFHGDPKSVAQRTDKQKMDCCGQPQIRRKSKTEKPSPSWPWTPLGPLRGAEQRRNAGGLRLALFEPQASLARRPAFRVAQGTGVAGTDPGSPSFCLLFLGEARKSKTPRQGGTPAMQSCPTNLNSTHAAHVQHARYTVADGFPRSTAVSQSAGRSAIA